MNHRSLFYSVKNILHGFFQNPSKFLLNFIQHFPSLNQYILLIFGYTIFHFSFFLLALSLSQANTAVTLLKLLQITLVLFGFYFLIFFQSGFQHFSLFSQTQTPILNSISQSKRFSQEFANLKLSAKQSV